MPASSYKLSFQRIQPLPLVEDLKTQWLLIVLPGVFVAFFLNVFEPFSIHGANWYHRLVIAGYGVLASLLLCINEFFIRPSLKIFFLPEKWTFGKSVLWFSWTFFLIAIGMFLYKSYWCGWTCDSFSVDHFFTMIYRTFIIGLFPLLAYILVMQIRILKRQQRVAIQDKKIQLSSENEREQLILEPRQLLYIQCSDNYATVYYQTVDQLHKKLLRSSLSRLEEQLKNFNIKRCHRSFIVNLDQVQYLKANGKGMRLHLKGEEVTIPVSNKYLEEIQSCYNF